MQTLSLTDLGKHLFAQDLYLAYLGSLAARAEFWKSSNVRIFSNDKVGIGSGFFISPNVIATANHVLEWFSDVSFQVAAEDGDEYEVESIHPHPDSGTDIACILIRGAFSGRPMLVSSEPKVLDEVLVFGYPPIANLSDILIATRGEVSALAKDYYGRGRDIR